MKKIIRDNSKVRKNFHQAKWDEPIIFELSNKGERGIYVSKSDEGIISEVGDGVSVLPESMRRKTALNLPEISQARILRHYVRLSQMTLGACVNIEIGQGTCTMKYSPKINDQLANLPTVAEMHPLQDESTAQGMMEIFYKTDLCMREISGMSGFTFQPGSGSQGIMAMASVVKAYFDDKGEGDTRDEIITTLYSHPSDAAAPVIKGYKIIHIHPDENGYPDPVAFKAAVSNKTAAFFVANPEDTGIYNHRVVEFTSLVHEFGGLCCYDQANANGLLGVTRAVEAGFDMCFFNLHKTFSTPHGCGGPACGATGAVEKLMKYMPAPLVVFDGERYSFDYNSTSNPYAVGSVRSFYGVAQVVLKAYAWICALGPNGLYQVAKTAVLNNNYMFRKLMEIDCVDVPYIPNEQRIEQTRYTLEKLFNDTGVTSGEIQRRMMDFGMHYWTSHHPYHIPEPMTLEPTESPSKEDLDEYIETLKFVFNECYTDPEKVKSAPHQSTIHQVDESGLDDIDTWAITWKSYLKKTAKQ